MVERVRLTKLPRRLERQFRQSHLASASASARVSRVLFPKTDFLKYCAGVILNKVKELSSICLTKFLYPLYKASLRLCEILFSPIDRAKLY